MRIFLSELKKHKYSFFWFAVHVLVGILATLSALPVVGFFYVVFLYSLVNVFQVSSQDRPKLLAEIIIYFASFESIGRLAQADPFLPYELGKYILLLLSPLGILLSKGRTIKGALGFMILVLAIPAIFFDESGRVAPIEVRFNILGLLNIGFAIWFFSSLKINLRTLVGWSKLLIYPIVSVLVFTIIRTPDLDSVDFSLGANFSTSGGFGSNQVSTILGLGVFLTAACILLNYRLTGFRWMDFVLLLLLTTQGLLTFSRGGMIGGILGVLVMIYYLTKLSMAERKRLSIPNFKKFVLPLVVFLFIVAAVANSITGGMLLLRYMGETQGTLTGTADKSLDKITSNRAGLFVKDIELFVEYPVMGVGVGASTYLREDFKGYAPHIELSRLLAEHGILGLLIFSVFIAVFILNKNKAPENISRGFLLACFIIGFLATFHSATRTYITPLLMGISSVLMVNMAKRNVKQAPAGNPKPMPLSFGQEENSRVSY
jgi:hypothetical protein